MAIEITVDEAQAIPRQTTVVITCDVASDFFCVGFTVHVGDVPAARARATKCGWLERHAGGRLFICPACVDAAPKPDATFTD